MQDTKKTEETNDKKDDKKDIGLNTTGDPGSTPGAAEGDRETVEADLKEKQQKGFFEDQKQKSAHE